MKQTGNRLQAATTELGHPRFTREVSCRQQPTTPTGPHFQRLPVQQMAQRHLCGIEPQQHRRRFVDGQSLPQLPGQALGAHGIGQYDDIRRHDARVGTHTGNARTLHLQRQYLARLKHLGAFALGCRQQTLSQCIRLDRKIVR
ncbi:hypothetical protein D3C81_1077240 [compost metagenome]